MHRKPDAELLPLDIELERTLRNLKKVQSAELAVMVEQRVDSKTLRQKQQQKGLRGKGLWRIFGG